MVNSIGVQMPHAEEDRIKALFADLGKPTLRGIRKCHKCGTVNGTRGNSCKNKSCDVVFRDNGSKKKTFTEACKVLAQDTLGPVYSVRLRREHGPDHRSFVQVSNVDDNTRGRGENSSAATDYKCYAESCATKLSSHCSHVTAVRRCFAESQLLKILPAAFLNLNMPYEIRQEISKAISMEDLVQRVSDTSFVVKCVPSENHPLGILHLMVLKPNQFETLGTKYVCACRAQKSQSRGEVASAPGDATSKYCSHFYYALCAFASDETLASEFDYLLAQETLKFTPLFNHLEISELGNHGSGNSIDEFSASNHSHVSVEFLKGNISFSLLENFSTADETVISNVQELECVLEDHVIVANAGDDFPLDDGVDMQDFGPPDDTMSGMLPMRGISCDTDEPQPHKRRKPGTSDFSSASCNRKVSPVVSNGSNDKHQNPKLDVQKPADPLHGNQVCRKTLSSKRNLSVINSRVPAIEFDQWLAGVIERINLSLNYGNSLNPDPLVYTISSDFFEYLKERIVSGVKKKRLPNQTSIIKRQDICPGKTYTRHVWKISHLLLLKRIFDSNLVPFKWTQQFMKTNQGIYEEWTKPNTSQVTGNNLQIAPVLQSAFIKIGHPNHLPRVGEPSAFIIEWIPDLYPISKMGELTFKYEIVHSS